MTGTAATGAAIPDATITLKDAAGTTVTTTTDADGNYSIDTTGLAAPFLVQVDDAVNGVTYYSVSASVDAVTVINITPLTDLIIRSWYDVQGVAVDDAFADPVTNPAPTPVVVEVIADVVLDIVQLWMDQAGVTAENFDLISTPFAADGTGVDQVLDQLTIDTTSGSPVIMIEDAAATTTQETTMTYDTETGAISVTTVTEGDSGTSSSTGGTVVPVGTAEEDAFAGIMAGCNAFAAAVSAKSATTLTAADLLPFIAQGAVWGGLDRTQFAQVFASHFQGMTISFSGITVRSLDTVTNVADVVFQITMSMGGQTASETREFLFKKVGDAWLLYGNQRIANIDLRAGTTTNAGIGGENTSTMVEVYVEAPQDSVTGVNVTGGPWYDEPLLLGDQGAMGGITMDSFGIYEIDPSVSGMEFTLDFTLNSTALASYTKPLNAITTEPIYYTSISTTGTTIEEAVAAPIDVVWTLPQTFAIAQMRIGTVAVSDDPNSTQDFKCDSGGTGGSPVLSNDAVSATVTIPATCQGHPAYKAEIYVQAFGINGEFTTAYYVYGDSM